MAMMSDCAYAWTHKVSSGAEGDRRKICTYICLLTTADRRGGVVFLGSESRSPA